MIDFSNKLIVNALIASIFLGLALPLIGRTIVFKKVSMIGDTLTHTSLVGVILGIIISRTIYGKNTQKLFLYSTIGSIIVCLIAVVILELLRKKYKKFSDVSLVIVLTVGLGLTNIISQASGNRKELEAILFGDIFSISSSKRLASIIVFSIIIILFTIIMYRQLYLISFDMNTAKLSGVKNAELINIIFMLFVALTIGISVKLIGGLMLGSILIVPVANSLIISKSYFKITIFSAFFGALYLFIGTLIASIDFGNIITISAGAVSSCLAAVLLIISLLIKKCVILIKGNIYGKSKKRKRV